MKTLSIMQPWASLIVGGPRAPGPKRTENRGRNLATYARSLVGQRIAIHASKRPDVEAFEDWAQGCFGFGLRNEEWPYNTRLDFPLGAVVGVATLDRVFGPGEKIDDDDARFYVGNDLLQDGSTFGLSFGSRRWIAPIACSGALGFWTLPIDIERQVVEQLGERAA